MKLIRIVSLVIAYAISFDSIAGNVWKNVTNIEGVQALNDERYILYLPAGSDPICNENGKLFYVVPGQNGITSEGSKNILTLALVAFSTGKKVSVLYDNSTSSCHVQQIHLRNDS